MERTPTDALSNRAKSTDNIGVWVGKRELDAFLRYRDAINGEHAEDALLAAAERADSDRFRPDSAQLTELTNIYFKKVNPILPIVDEQEFRRVHAAGHVPEPFVHALCLVAAKDGEAQPFLRSNDSATSISPRDFCHKLHASVKSALTSSTRYDKTTLVRMLALVSLHNEGADGAEVASMHLSQAIHHAQTMGLQLGQQADLSASDGLPMKLLFWCLWTLDRFNAASAGRPLLMADNDIAIETFTPGESRYPAFEILFCIAGMLNDAISFYRPGNAPTVTGWEDNFPSFEEVVDRLYGSQLSSSLLATLHVAYLAVAILSHRSKGIKDYQSSTSSHVRQSLAVIKVVRLMDSERLNTLHPLHILPYTASLTMAVVYKQLRQVRFDHQREDARSDFEACCRILKNLRRTWKSVDVMAALAQKVLDEVHRAPNLRVTQADSSVARRAQAVTAPLLPSAGGEEVDLSQMQADPKHAAADNSIAYVDDGAVDRGDPIDHQIDSNLLEGMDDIFGTYLDPNYPVNLEDLSFLEDLDTVDWNTGNL